MVSNSHTLLSMAAGKWWYIWIEDINKTKQSNDIHIIYDLNFVIYLLISIMQWFAIISQEWCNRPFQQKRSYGVSSQCSDLSTIGLVRMQLHHTSFFNVKLLQGSLPEASYGLWVLLLPASVCPSIRVCGNNELVRAITQHPFKLESPNLDQKMQNILLKVCIVLRLVKLNLRGQI